MLKSIVALWGTANYPDSVVFGIDSERLSMLREVTEDDPSGIDSERLSRPC